MKSSPTDSTRTLVFGVKKLIQKFERVHPDTIRYDTEFALENRQDRTCQFSLVRALNESGVGKIHNFQPISRRISETVLLIFEIIELPNMTQKQGFLSVAININFSFNYWSQCEYYGQVFWQLNEQ